MATPEESFLGIFLDEARDILDQWERNAIAFHEQASKEIVDSLFRAAHNLKGSSRSVGLQAFGSFIHQVEDLITDVGQGRVPQSEEVRNILMDTHEIMSHWIEQLSSQSDYIPDTSNLVERLKRLRHEPIPPHGEGAAFGLFDDPPARDSTPRASSSVTTPSHTSSETSPSQKDPALQKPSAAPSKEGKEGKTNLESDESIRIPARKIDTIFRSLSELSIQMSAIEHLFKEHIKNSPALMDGLEKAAKLVRYSQEEVLALRMLPLRGLFQRLERTVLDISRKMGKRIEFVTQGEETELDKYVLEQIKDPLIHLVRNAIDHGIEPTDERKALGKKALGTVTIKALERSGSVQIMISDDGRGLNDEKILQKAREKGLVGPEKTLSPSDIKNLIFLPGFSTADLVSDISGRGVGMDVVRTAISNLRGEISITSTKGAGTTFCITLPSTLSLSEVLIVESSGKEFAVPISDITEIIELNTALIAARDAKGESIKYQDKIMPIIALNSQLGLGKSEYHANKAQRLALIGHSERGFAAITIDRILGQKTVVTRPMTGNLKKLSHFSGMTLLGNGEPCLILDMRQLTEAILMYLQRPENRYVA